MNEIEAVYGSSRAALRNLTNRTRRCCPPASLTLDPFLWDENEHRGGGAWMSRTPVHWDRDGGIQELSPAPSPRAASPSGVRNIMLNGKDKEALLEESIRLKRALQDQDFFLRRDKVHVSTVQIENRRLEFDIKDMETQGALESVKSPPPGTSMRSRFKGLKIRYEDLRTACDAQFEELATLRRDVRPTATQEIEMERDALLSEISRMHKDVTGLRTLQNALKCEQKGLSFIKIKADELENVNQSLENCMDAVHKELARTSHDMVVFNQKMIESSLEARKNAKRFKELQEHTEALKILIDKEKSERLDLDRQLVGLEEQLKKVEEELVAKTSPPRPKEEALTSLLSKEGIATVLKKAASKPATPAKLDPALHQKSTKPSTAPSKSFKSTKPPASTKAPTPTTSKKEKS